MKNNLIALSDLMDLLGYSDDRSIEKWCKNNKIPIIHMGKKKYTLHNFLELFINERLKDFVFSQFSNAEQIIEAINADNKVEFAELINAPAVPLAKRDFKIKTKNKQIQDYINHFKTA